MWEQHGAHREIRLLPAMHLSIFVGLCGSLPNCIYWKPWRHKYAKHSVAICFFPFFLFRFFFVSSSCFLFFSKEKCRSGIPESPEKKNNKKETRKKAKKQIQSTLAHVFGFSCCIFVVVCFLVCVFFVFCFCFFIIFWFPLNWCILHLEHQGLNRLMAVVCCCHVVYHVDSRRLAPSPFALSPFHCPS